MGTRSGEIVAFLVMLATVGVRSDFGSETHCGFMALKLLFALSLIGTGTVFLIRAISPGRGSRKLFLIAFLPFLVIGLAGLVALVMAAANSESCIRMMMGMRWQTCLLCIPLFAVIPFVAHIGMRQGAPTNLTHTGAIAGLVAGALGATAYAFNCADDALPIYRDLVWRIDRTLCVIGAKLGPKLLRR